MAINILKRTKQEKNLSTGNTHRKWEQKQWKPNAKSSRRLHLKGPLQNRYNMWYLEDQGRTEGDGVQERARWTQDKGDTKWSKDQVRASARQCYFWQQIFI